MGYTPVAFSCICKLPCLGNRDTWSDKILFSCTDFLPLLPIAQQIHQLILVNPVKVLFQAIYRCLIASRLCLLLTLEQGSSLPPYLGVPLLLPIGSPDCLRKLSVLLNFTHVMTISPRVRTITFIPYTCCIYSMCVRVLHPIVIAHAGRSKKRGWLTFETPSFFIFCDPYRRIRRSTFEILSP